MPGYQDTAGDVMELARSTMNDAAVDPETGAPMNPAVWTDFKLLPFLQSAYRRFQRDLATRGVKNREVDVVLTMPAGATAIDNTGTPPNVALPDDFLFPIFLKERQTGSTRNYTDVVEAHNGLPQQLQPQAQFRFYEDTGDVLKFNAASQSNDIWLRYIQALAKLADANSKIAIRDAVDALAARTALMAARARGVTVFKQDLEEWYQEELTEWVAQHYRTKQRQPARRRAYGSKRRVIFF